MRTGVPCKGMAGPHIVECKRGNSALLAGNVTIELLHLQQSCSKANLILDITKDLHC